MTDRRQYRALILSVVKHDYIANAVACHPRFKPVAVADEADQPEWVHDRNRQFADKNRIPYFRSFDDALADSQPDVAIISSQAERHCSLAVRAADAGLHFIVDKPLSTKLSECDRLCAAVERSGVRTLLWNRNYLPALLQTRDAIRSGAIGDIRAIHCDFYFSKDAGPPKGSRESGAPPINWLERQIEAHADGSDGGVGVEPMGELQVEGIYPLAYMRMLISTPIHRVFARTTAHTHQAHVDNNVDDLATVTLQFTDGQTGSLCIGRIAAACHPDLGAIKLHILGSEGALIVNESRPEVAVFYRDQPPLEFRHQRVADENDFLLVDEFARAIDDGGQTILDVHAGREICEVIEGCLRSAESGEFESVLPRNHS